MSGARITGFSWRKGYGLMSLGETKPKNLNQKGRKKRRKGILTSLPQWQWSQLNAIIDAEIKNRSAPNPPRKWKEKFGQLVTRCGGASAWARARAHEEYGAIKKLKIKKLSKRGPAGTFPSR